MCVLTWEGLASLTGILGKWGQHYRGKSIGFPPVPFCGITGQLNDRGRRLMSVAHLP